MIAHLKELEVLGAVIDGETQVDIVLITLLESFKIFCLSYYKSRGFCSLAEFLKGLQAAQGIIGHQEHLQVVEIVLRLLQIRITRMDSSSSFEKKNNKKKRLLNQRVSV